MEPFVCGVRDTGDLEPDIRRTIDDHMDAVEDLPL